METEKDIKKYEVGFLGRTENAKDEIIKLLESYKAKIVDNGKMSMLKLAYPIKKEKSAFFGYLHFAAYPNIIKKFEDSLKLSQQILRFIMIASPINSRPFIESRAPKVRIPSSEIPAIKRVEVKKPKVQVALSNEALEKKLEEILK